MERIAQHLDALEVLITVARADHQETHDPRYLDLVNEYIALQCETLWFYQSLLQENNLITECEQVMASPP